MAHRILIVEDDTDLAGITEVHLKHAGYLSDTALSLSDAVLLLDQNVYSLILMDVILPDGTSEELCRSIREKCGCPIIFLSCLDDGGSMITAFDAGADEYMVKPVNFDDLLLSIEKHIWNARTRSGADTTDWNECILRFKHLVIDVERHNVLVEGVKADLSAIEFSLLTHLVAKRDALVLYEDLYRHVWSAECLGDVRTVMVHISNLRRKIDPSRKGLISTVRGAGYIFSDV